MNWHGSEKICKLNFTAKASIEDSIGNMKRAPSAAPDRANHWDSHEQSQKSLARTPPRRSFPLKEKRRSPESEAQSSSYRAKPKFWRQTPPLHRSRDRGWQQVHHSSHSRRHKRQRSPERCRQGQSWCPAGLPTCLRDRYGRLRSGRQIVTR